jgi:[ribosomal protein S18]-alanine N-acetyltransferase
MTQPQLRSITLARDQDADEIARMSRDLIEQGLGWSWTAGRVRRAIAFRECCGIVVRCDSGLAAFAIMQFGDDHAHLNLLAVAPASRRQGLGRAMMNWLRQSAEIAGIRRIDLELRTQNQEARLFYEDLGFMQRGVAERYYQGREPALRMSLEL